MLWSKQESSKKCVLPTAFVLVTLHQCKTSYANASPPSHHYACPNPKQTQGPLRSHNIPSPKKIHNVSLQTNAFHSNLDRIYTILHSNSLTHNYSIDSTTHIWGDPISIIIFFSTNY